MSELDLECNADRPGEALFLDGEDLKLDRAYLRDSADTLTPSGRSRCGTHAGMAVPVSRGRCVKMD